MTGSIGLQAIQVQPMGAPPSVSIPPPDNPSEIEKRRACRNLFGCVKPGSTKIELRNEQQSKLAAFTRRYHVNWMDVVMTQQKPQHNLIEQEQQEYEKRLALNENEKNDKDTTDESQEKCNSTIEKLSENAETTPQPHRSSHQRNEGKPVQQQQLVKTSASRQRNHCGNSPRSQSNVAQKRISECFTIRKKPCIDHHQKYRPDLSEETAPSPATFLLPIVSSAKATISINDIQQQKNA